MFAIYTHVTRAGGICIEVLKPNRTLWRSSHPVLTRKVTRRDQLCTPAFLHQPVAIWLFLPVKLSDQSCFPCTPELESSGLFHASQEAKHVFKTIPVAFILPTRSVCLLTYFSIYSKYASGLTLRASKVRNEKRSDNVYSYVDGLKTHYKHTLFKGGYTKESCLTHNNIFKFQQNTKHCFLQSTHFTVWWFWPRISVKTTNLVSHPKRCSEGRNAISGEVETSFPCNEPM